MSKDVRERYAITNSLNSGQENNSITYIKPRRDFSKASISTLTIFQC